MLPRWEVGALAALLAVLAPGCGGGVDCSFTACGGDPVGAWEFAGVCADFDSFEDQILDVCASARVTASAGVVGTAVVDADGTYDTVLTVTTRATLTLPSECFEGQPITSCDDLEGASGLACSGSIESSCRCQLSDSQDASASGTWTTSGNTITLDDGGDPDDAEYCVSGDTLKLRIIPDEPDDPIFTYVLERQ